MRHSVQPVLGAALALALIAGCSAEREAGIERAAPAVSLAQEAQPTTARTTSTTADAPQG